VVRGVGQPGEGGFEVSFLMFLLSYFLTTPLSLLSQGFSLKKVMDSHNFSYGST